MGGILSSAVSKISSSFRSEKNEAKPEAALPPPPAVSNEHKHQGAPIVKSAIEAEKIQKMPLPQSEKDDEETNVGSNAQGGAAAPKVASNILESNKNGGIIASNYKEKGTILFGISVVVLILLFAYYKFCRAGKMAPRRRRKKSMPKRA